MCRMSELYGYYKSHYVKLSQPHDTYELCLNIVRFDSFFKHKTCIPNGNAMKANVYFEEFVIYVLYKIKAH